MTCKINKSNIKATNLTEKELNLPEGVPPLISLYLYISGSCNLACRHCWITPTHQTGGNGGQHIDVDDVRKAICEARPLGLQTVKLTGGEPMLHPNFRELISMAHCTTYVLCVLDGGRTYRIELA